MEKHLLAFKDQFNPNELANIVYSYSKSPDCNKELLTDLEPTVRGMIHKAKPKEMTSMLMAYTEAEKMNDGLLKVFENEFKAKFEEMNAEDISKYYYCFTKLGFKGDGTLYRYLQKAGTKLMKTFEGPHLQLMFYKFDEEDKTRLNVGFRGRLIDRVNDLIKEKKSHTIKGLNLDPKIMRKYGIGQKKS